MSKVKPDGRQNNGRRKGAINKRTKALIDKAERNGKMLPAEFLLKQMHNRKNSLDVRMQAAAAAAPYYHARLQAIKHSGQVELTHEQALKQLAE